MHCIWAWTFIFITINNRKRFLHGYTCMYKKFQPSIFSYKDKLITYVYRSLSATDNFVKGVMQNQLTIVVKTCARTSQGHVNWCMFLLYRVHRPATFAAGSRRTGISKNYYNNTFLGSSYTLPWFPLLWLTLETLLWLFLTWNQHGETS